MMINKKLLYVILITVLVIGGGIFLYMNRSITLTDDIYKCNEDDDCISVKSGCCGCTAGGSNTAINRTYLDYWNNKMLDECKEISCLAVISNHWTCFAKPKCINDKCQLVR